jgi:hypothetical protein
VLQFPKPLEPIRQFGASLSVVRELADEQREWLGVSRDPQRASIDRIEPHVANQRGGQVLALRSSPQYTKLGRLALRLASYTPKSGSLGTVLNATTNRACGIFLASSSAPEEVWATTRSLFSSFIGSEHVTTTLPDRSPA